MPSDLITFHSVSLLLDEPPLLKGPSLASLLPLNPLPFKLSPLPNYHCQPSVHLTFLPDVFCKRLSAYSKSDFIEVNKIYRLVEMIRYNFSDGSQVSAKEILRHPHHKFVPDEFLPLIKTSSLDFGHWPITMWPLVQSESGPSLRPIEEIMQLLLSRLATAHRQKRLALFLQTHGHSNKSRAIETIEFDPGGELDWRVDFQNRESFLAGFKLVSGRAKRFYFFESYAYQPEVGLLVIHPWLNEFSQLQDQISFISKGLEVDTHEGMPTFEFLDETKTKQALNYLRSRLVPVKISGPSVSLAPEQSQTEIYLNELGHFYLKHDVRVPGQKNRQRKGWSDRAVFYLMTLSQGLPFAMDTQARDIASVDEFHRYWDLQLLKHLGILQFVFWETLFLHFRGHLSDETKLLPEALFVGLDEKIKVLLTINSDGYGSARLNDLCSKPVLACFEKFVMQIFKDISEKESFYSDEGEVIADGLIEREFRLLFELLSRQAMTTAGATFRKSRVPFLARISVGALVSKSEISKANYFFPDGSLSAALENLQFLVPFGFKLLLNDQPLYELAENELKINFQIKNRLDQTLLNWFELSPQFFLMGHSVNPDQFLRLGVGGVIEYENRLYLVPQAQMPSLRLLEQFWKKLQKGKDESARKSRREVIYQLPKNQTLFLLALRNAGIPFKGDEQWDQLCLFYDSLGKQNQMFTLPKTVTANLKKYQELGVQWLQDLYRLRLGALLADDMGLGKTLQALVFLEDLRSKHDMGSVLIVVPSSLVYNWCHEIEKFIPSLPVRIFSGENKESIANSVKAQKPELVIVTYGLLLEHIDVINCHPWNVVVFDEAQNLKNISAKRTTAARSLKARFKIALTGTPMENHYGEFYSLLDLLVPGCLGPIENFRSQYVNSPVVDYEIIKDLKLKVRPLLLRRSKKEILDQLPEKQETTVQIAFEDQQKEIYRDIALSYNQRVQEAMVAQGTANVQLQMFTALLRLRQACSDPGGLPDVKYDKTPPKLETLVDSLKEIIESGESALVFTQFLQTLKHTSRLLKNAGLPVFVLHGGVSLPKRHKTLFDFNAHAGGAILLMTLKTGGVGLNLTKASYVFHIEPWWNPAVENQATDRAHRMGQTKAVQVFKYIMHKSLEEKIEILKEKKDLKFQSLFTDNEDFSKTVDTKNSISKEDFDTLLQI